MTTRTARWGWIARLAGFALLFLAFQALEFASFPEPSPVHSGDETVWPRISRHSVFSKEFYTSSRPFTVPLLFKLVNEDEGSVIAIQSAVSVLCWFALAIAVAREFETGWRQLLAAALVCGFSLTVPVNQWDMVIRSESASLSLLALTLALSLELARRLAARAEVPGALVVGWGFVALLYACARQTGTYWLATLWAGLALWLFFDAARRTPRGALPQLHPGIAAAVVALAFVVAFGHWTASRDPSTNLTNVLLQRVLPDPALYERFSRDFGLPRNPAFARYVGGYAWTPTESGVPLRERMKSDPQLADVRDWIHGPGARAYQRFLLWDAPGRAIRAAFAALDEHVNHFAPGFAKGAGRMRWTDLLSVVLYPKLLFASWLWAGVIGGGLALASLSSGARRLGLASAVLAVGAWVQAFVCYHGDAHSVPRHMLAAGLMLRLSGLGLALTLLRVTSDLGRLPGRRARLARTAPLPGRAHDPSGHPWVSHS